MTYITYIATRAGEGPTLYEGDDRAKAILAARINRHREVLGRQYVFVVDLNRVDVDDPGYVDWTDEIEPTLCQCEKFVIEEEPTKWWQERPATPEDADLDVGDVLCNKCEEIENG